MFENGIKILYVYFIPSFTGACYQCCLARKTISDLKVTLLSVALLDFCHYVTSELPCYQTNYGRTHGSPVGWVNY